MLLIIDNYDSFTYNLAQYFGELGESVKVERNDAVDIADIEALKPTRIVISPGPCTPLEAGISTEVIRHFAGKVAIFGVCLGHQAIGSVFGGKIVRAQQVMHGKLSDVFHDNQGVFEGLQNPMQVTRYHSLLIERESLPSVLELTAKTWEDEIMGVRHRDFVGTRTPIEGVQFHPESIKTLEGMSLLQNFLQNSVPLDEEEK